MTLRRLFLFAAIPLLVSIFAISITVWLQARQLIALEHATVERAYMDSKRAELRHYVDIAVGASEVASRDEQDPEMAQRKVQDALAALDFGTDGYFFLYDLQGRNLMHPRQPELVGQDLWNLKDANGQPVIQDLIAQAKAGGGYVRYLWNKPSTGKAAPKLAYVTVLKRWNWMLGTGLYLDDVDAALAAGTTQIENNVVHTVQWIAAIAASGILLIGVCWLGFNIGAERVREAKLKRLAHRVVQAQEEERMHLARELHDGTSQTLVSAKLMLEACAKQMAKEDRSTLVVEQALKQVNSALHEVRAVSHRLRPAMLDVLGLPAAMKQLLDEYRSQRQLDVQFHCDPQPHCPLPFAIPETISTALYRVTQEALTNVDKHARATKLSVSLNASAETGLSLVISDDGVGFDLRAVRQDPRQGIGLRNMRERIEGVGGIWSIHSTPGDTEIRVTIAPTLLQLN